MQAKHGELEAVGELILILAFQLVRLTPYSPGPQQRLPFRVPLRGARKGTIYRAIFGVPCASWL